MEHGGVAGSGGVVIVVVVVVGTVANGGGGGRGVVVPVPPFEETHVGRFWCRSSPPAISGLSARDESILAGAQGVPVGSRERVHRCR